MSDLRRRVDRLEQAAPGGRCRCVAGGLYVQWADRPRDGPRLGADGRCQRCGGEVVIFRLVRESVART